MIFFKKLYKRLQRIYDRSIIPKLVLNDNIQADIDIRFSGIPIFNTNKTGRIIIGKQSQFISRSSDNPAGISRPCQLEVSNDATIQIGNRCGFSGTVMNARSKIEIGDDVLCGADVRIFDNDFHPTDPEMRITNRNHSSVSPVVIESNTFIGTNSIILKGVKIGTNSVIAAGSIVTKSFPANSLIGGNPARLIKKI